MMMTTRANYLNSECKYTKPERRTYVQTSISAEIAIRINKTFILL